MSKQSRPTTEELKFVYDLILKGNDDSDILEEYARLYEAGQLMWPWRTDKRFVRERRKELEAAQEVLKGHLGQQSAVSVEGRKQHFEHVAEVARLLLHGGLEKLDTTQIGDKYEIIHEGYVEESLTRDQLIGALEGNLDVACQTYGTWEVFECLMNHVEAEYPACQDIYGFIENSPVEFIDIIRMLAARKTFKGTCPVCKDWQ